MPSGVVCKKNIMKQTVFRYGIFAALTIFVLSLVNFLLIANKADYSVQEAAGYLSIFISMIFVFLGIRYFRDQVNGGALSFGLGLKTGVLIVLIPAVFFGLFNIFYTEVIDPSWLDQYYNHYITEAKKTIAPEKLEVELKNLQEQKELFGNPVMQFFIMAGTVFVIGFIVTILSSLTLMRKKR
jgi:Protein of unknown function (DUF4199)